MRFSVEAKAFRDALAVAMTGVGRATIPILECVRVEARDNALHLSGSNMDIEVHAKCEAAVMEVGTCCVNASDLRAILGPMRGAVSGSGNLTLECGPAKMTISALSEDFPRMKKPGGEFEIEGGAAAYLACIAFASTEEARYHLRGVCFSGDVAVATNGASFLSVPCPGGAGQIVPLEAKAAIQKIGGRLFLSDTTWRVENDGCAAMGKLVDGSFPDWTRLDFDADPFCQIDADALSEAVAAVTVGRAAYAALTLGDGGYVVSGDRFSGARIDGRYEVMAEGDPLPFVCSTPNLLRVLSAFEGEVVGISTNGTILKFSGASSVAFLSPIRDARTELQRAAA